VYDNGSDNVFESIITVDIETGFYTEGRDTKFTSCHSWISMQSLIPTSTFAEVHGDTAVFDNPRIDTMRYGFKLYNTHTRIINAHMLWNLSVYTSAYQSSQPIFIKCEQQTIYEYVHAVNTEIVANAAHLNVRVKNKTSNLDKFVNTNLVTGGLGTFDKASYYEYGTYYGAGTITAQNGFTIDATSYVKSNDARKKGEFYLYATATATNPDWIVPCNVSVKPTATVRVQGFSITNNGVSFYGTLNNTGDLAILHGFAVGEKFWLKVEYDIA
jgi:hypothetical protein